MSQRYDVIVIGGGPAGSTAARVAAREKYAVALIERDKLGGTCLNYGCDPTKALLDSAHAYVRACRADELGFHMQGAHLVWEDALARAHRIIDEIRAGDELDAIERQQARGIDVHMGTARFISPRQISVNDEILEADRIIIATGARPMIPPIEGLRESGYLTNETILEKGRSLPARMAIIGGGAISTEFTQILTRFGVHVTTIELRPHLLYMDDSELAMQLQEILEDEGARIICGAKAERVSGTGPKQLRLRFEDDRTIFVEADEILVAAGRVPNSDSLDCAAAGVTLLDDGSIKVDDFLRTTQSGIYAAGDVCSPDLPFTHVASPQGALALRNAFSDTPSRFNREAIPHATYTDPTLAAIGRTEEQLQEDGVEYCVGRTTFKDTARGRTSGHQVGCVKILADADGKLLGGHILAEHADDLIGPIALAMREGLPVTALANTIFPYPTFVEALGSAATQIRPS